LLLKLTLFHLIRILVYLQYYGTDTVSLSVRIQGLLTYVCMYQRPHIDTSFMGVHYCHHCL